MQGERGEVGKSRIKVGVEKGGEGRGGREQESRIKKTERERESFIDQLRQVFMNF